MKKEILLSLLVFLITFFSYIGHGNAQDVVDVLLIRDAETLAIIVQGNVPVSLEGLTIQATNGRGEMTAQRLQDFPAYQGLPFDRILTPTCFYIRSNSSNRVPPQECQMIDMQQFYVQQLPSANLFWYDAQLLVQNTIEIRRGADSFGICGVTAVSCTFAYAPPQPPVTPTPTAPQVTAPTDVIPCTATITISGITLLRDAPDPAAQIAANVNAGDYPVTGVVGEPPLYWEINYNGTVAYVNAGSFDISVKPNPCTQGEDETENPELGNGPFTLQYDESAEGRLPAGDAAIIQFTALEGETVSVAVDAEFDGVLELYGTNSDLPLLTDDDSGGNRNPQINEFKVPEGGEYELRLRAYNTSQQGYYRVTLVEGAIADEASAACAIDYYETKSDILEANEVVTYCFKGTEGDIVTIDVDAAFDSLLQLNDAAGDTIIDNDDRAQGNYNPLIELFTLPETGEYEIVLRGYAASSRGAFSMTLSRGVQGEAEELSYGQVKMQRLLAGESAFFVFDGTVGDRVSIFVESDFDAQFSLRNARGEEVAYDDDSAGNQQPAIQDFVLEDSGNYFIIISGFGPQESGTFTVILSAR